MDNARKPFSETVNWSRFKGPGGGFYESYFLRGNHPSRPLAFWIRYTLFSPRRNPEDTEGELWGIVFDGERSRHHALKAVVPWTECRFDTKAFDVSIGDAALGSGRANGAIRTGKSRLAWDLAFSSPEAPLLFFPERAYDARFPAAKLLVGLPHARFEGTIDVDGERTTVDGWTGSQNHNWGPRHTDRYAWGQVSGFDTHPDSFLEVATAQLKIGPLWTPRLTSMVLRHRGREHALNSIPRMLASRGRVDDFDWTFQSENRDVRIKGRISARREDFVGLTYRNPIGGTKTCLNSKIAACRITVQDKATGESETLETANRAAFEILTDDRTHGVPVAV